MPFSSGSIVFGMFVSWDRDEVCVRRFSGLAFAGDPCRIRRTHRMKSGFLGMVRHRVKVVPIRLRPREMLPGSTLVFLPIGLECFGLRRTLDSLCRDRQSWLFALALFLFCINEMVPMRPRIRSVRMSAAGI